MKLFILISTFLIGIGLLLSTAIYMAPNYFYYLTVNKGESSRWYSIENYDTSLLKPNQNIPFEAQKLKNENLWQLFHFGDLRIPLPVKNPFYLVVPNLQYKKKQQKTKFGISILNPSQEKISEIYFLPNIRFPVFFEKQELFELPLVRNNIINKSNDMIWEDAFKRDISNWNIDIKTMAYNFYLMQFRSSMLRGKVIRYGHLEGISKVIVEFEYPNKDYTSELVMEKRGNLLYSFVIVSRKESQEAQVLRYKFIKDMEYLESTPSLADIILNEFKSLTYMEQNDHLGMLYILSAWSHNDSRKEFLQKAIFSLERGKNNQKQLEKIYKYYFDRYGEVYSEREVKGLNLDKDIQLNKSILHEKNKVQNTSGDNFVPSEKRDLDDEFEKLIEDSKKNSKDDSDTMRID